jgi:hypothetical protein
MRNLRALVVIPALALLVASAFGSPGVNVGFEEIHIANGGELPLAVGVWYPTDAPGAEQLLGLFSQAVAPGAPVAGRNLPLVVISHGGGGSYESHYDTALALAHAGFVAAAVSHGRCRNTLFQRNVAGTERGRVEVGDVIKIDFQPLNEAVFNCASATNCSFVPPLGAMERTVPFPVIPLLRGIALNSFRWGYARYFASQWTDVR